MSPAPNSTLDDPEQTISDLRRERDEALGKAWHVPNAAAVSHRAVIEQVYRLAGHDPALRVVPRWMVAAMAPFDATLREVKEMLYQLEEDFVLDSARFTRTFGLSATPLDDAIRATLSWYRDCYSAQK